MVIFLGGVSGGEREVGRVQDLSEKPIKFVLRKYEKITSLPVVCQIKHG